MDETQAGPKEDAHLYEQLSHGFEALLGKVEALIQENQDLTHQMRHLRNEQGKNLASPPLSSVPLISTGDVLPIHDLTTGSKDQTLRVAYTLPAEWYTDKSINEGLHAWRVLCGRSSNAHGVSSQETRRPGASEAHPSTSKDVLPESPYEQDFTTSGRTGELKCPFATMAVRSTRHKLQSGSLTSPPSIKELFMKDPIAAEFHADEFESPPGSVAASASKCPIRFLDQHSPEEVAKYFENHKHEIPRSHELCVKRYQTNEESIRQLDAKYGNLVSMIQGLGMKHKPMLQNHEEEDASVAAMEQRSIENIKDWAENCTEEVDPAVPEKLKGSGLGEDRTGRFERPLKEVRLGESPSRPWGIQVPYNAKAVSSVSEVGLPHLLDPLAEPMGNSHGGVNLRDGNEPSLSKCPFGHSNPVLEPEASSKAAPLPTQPPAQKATASQNLLSPEPRMVFTGPVFIGYSIEQMSALTQQFRSTP